MASSSELVDFLLTRAISQIRSFGTNLYIFENTPVWSAMLQVNREELNVDGHFLLILCKITPFLLLARDSGVPDLSLPQSPLNDFH